MPTILLRWALPHRGPCTHLTGFEYRLRILVFGALYFAALLPTAIGAVFIAFGAIPGLLIMVGLSGVMNGESIWVLQGEIIIVSLACATCLLTYLFSRFLQHQYLTSRGRKRFQ
ncbi:hypothetical protein [Aureimonas sp. SK2]|uniref:hypothetical protein n=1 Tax=Aureimonas sp. SK2 TaxID=3015992 RepID=UPI002443C3D1|nr:hypothetical protein [Aureimonas sp. SK2]